MRSSMRQWARLLAGAALLVAAAVLLPQVEGQPEPGEPLSFMHNMAGGPPVARARAEDIPYIRCQVRLAAGHRIERAASRAASKARGSGT